MSEPHVCMYQFFFMTCAVLLAAGLAGFPCHTHVTEPSLRYTQKAMGNGSDMCRGLELMQIHVVMICGRPIDPSQDEGSWGAPGPS